MSFVGTVVSPTVGANVVQVSEFVSRLLLSMADFRHIYPLKEGRTLLYLVTEVGSVLGAPSMFGTLTE